MRTVATSEYLNRPLRSLNEVRNARMTISNFERRHFMALDAIGDDPFTVVQDDMPATMFNLLQINAFQETSSEKFIEILDHTPTTIVVKRTKHGQKAVEFFKGADTQERLNL